MASVKLLLDLRSNVLLDVVLLEGGGRNVDALLLHLLGHVDVFDDGLGCDAGEICVSRRGLGVCGRGRLVHFGGHGQDDGGMEERAYLSRAVELMARARAQGRVACRCRPTAVFGALHHGRHNMRAPDSPECNAVSVCDTDSSTRHRAAPSPYTACLRRASIFT